MAELYQKHTCWLALGATIAITIAEGCGSGIDSANMEATKPQKIRISKETTRLTGPLTADGEVDFIAAVDQRMRAGVTPENNAAVLFWQAIGPQAIDVSVRAEFLKRLGIELPAEGAYLVGMKDFYEKLPEYGPQRPDEDWKAHDERLKLWGEIALRPWTADEFPHAARWLEVNERPLQLVAEGARRPEFYEPCIAKDGKSIGRVFVAGKSYREIIRALNCRVLLRLGSGDVEGAWTDVKTLYDLARCLRCKRLINALMGIFAEGMARDRIADLAYSGKLTAQEARQWEAVVSAFPLPSWTPTDEEELWLYPFLQITTRLAQGKPTSDDDQRFIFPVSIATLAEREPVDFNQLLTIALAEYDAIVAGKGQLSRQELNRIHERVKGEAAALFGFALPEGPFASSADSAKVAEAIATAKTPSEKEHRIRAVIRLHFADHPLAPVREAHTRSVLNRQLARLALLLAAYRTERGAYPDSLAALGADQSLSIDPFNQQPLHYARKGDGYALYSPGPDAELHYGTKEHANYPSDYRDDVVLLTPDVRTAEKAAAP